MQLALNQAWFFWVAQKQDQLLGVGVGAFLVIMAYNGAVVAFQFMHYMHFEMSTQWQLQRQGSRLTAIRSGV